MSNKLEYKNTIIDIHNEFVECGNKLAINFQLEGDLDKLQKSCNTIQEGLNLLKDYIYSLDGE